MAKKRREVDPEYVPNLRKDPEWQDDHNVAAPHVQKRKKNSAQRREQLKLAQRAYRARIKAGIADPGVMARRQAENKASSLKFYEKKGRIEAREARIKHLEKEVRKLNAD